MFVHATSLLPAIVALPLAGAIVNGLFGRRLSRNVVHAIAVGVMAIAFTLSMRALYALAQVAQTHVADPQLEYKAWTWAVSGIFQLDIAFYLDPLSAVLLLIITGVGLLVHIFSMGHMAEDSEYSRYFAYLNLFVFSMLVLVLGKNLFMLFLGWQGISTCSYLLISFWFAEQQRAQAGQKSFIVNRVCDAGFLVGLILILFHAGGTTDYDVLKWSFASGQYGPFHDPYTLTLACLMLFVGLCGKAAQIPFHVWLPDAMTCPTPASALIHAAMVMVAAVYMVARLSFMYTLSPVAMGIMAIVGSLTALVAALFASAQKDIKKVLAYSVVSQLGLVVLAVGVGAYSAGLFHSVTHALFQTLLFLGAGSVIRAMQSEQNVFNMGGLKAKMPITRITFLVACLAIAGVPVFSGFFSQSSILWEVNSRGHALTLPENAHAAYSDDDAFLLGGRHGVVLKTTGDGNWSHSRLPVTEATVRGVRQGVPSNVRGISRDSEGTYWAVSDHASLFRSSNGERWVRVFVPPSGPQPGLKAVDALASNDVWAVGEQGWALHYDGAQVKKTVVPTSTTLRAIAAVSTNEVYAGGNGGVLLKWNGERWSELKSPTSAAITDLAKIGSDVWATTSQGLILKLNDAGGFDKKSVSVEGVQVQLLNGLARGTDRIIAFGRGIFGAEGPRAGVFVMNDDLSFVAMPGRSDVELQAGGLLRSSLFFNGDGRRLQLASLDGDDVTLTDVSSVAHKPAFQHILWIIGVLVSLLTAFYIFRLYFLVFEGEPRGNRTVWEQVQESPQTMTLPLSILAVFTLAGGGWESSLAEWLAPVFSIANGRLSVVTEHDWLVYVPLVSLFGIALAYLWYAKSSAMPQMLAERYPRISGGLVNALYIDKGIEILVIRPHARLARFLHRVVDEFLLDIMIVRAIGFVVKHVGRVFRFMQSGNVQLYAAFIAIGLMLLALLMGG
jgi:NADH:ubiquinone oxidoreductase subunit 5 (subunit L)/multisubunit Na+/H+ antiporter MnhA subunit